MIFNEKYNNIIDLMQETDNEFNEIYFEFASKLPERILKKCQKSKDFAIEIKDIGYNLETKLNENIAIELSTDNYNKNLRFLLTVGTFTKDTLDMLEICENEEEEKGTKLLNLGRFEIKKSTKSIYYSFSLKKINNKQYCIVSSKTYNNDEQETIRTEKTYSYDELLNKINIKPTRR